MFWNKMSEEKHHAHQPHHDSHSHGAEHAHHAHHAASAEGEGKGLDSVFLALIVVAALVVAVNQFSIANAESAFSTFATAAAAAGSAQGAASGKNLANVDLDSLKSTGHSVAALFEVESIQTPEDAIAVMIPTGTPEYGPAMGISYDDPVNSLNLMASSYESLKAKAKQSDPANWQRFLNLATKPVGISCEYCCGIGPVGIDGQGNSRCGCQHNPAVLTLTLWLMQNTEMSDAEILKEVLKWKALFFPKNMVELATQVAGGDTSSLDSLPGMVGGC